MGRVGHAWRNVRGYGLWILFVTGTLVAAGIWLYRSESERIQEAKFEELGSIAQLKVRQVLEWRRELKSDVERSTRSPYFREAVTRWFETPQDSAFTATFLERLRVEVDVDLYVDVLLLGSDCNFELSLHGHTELPIESAEACRRAVASGEAVIGALFERRNQAVSLDVIAPISSREGHAVGALGLRSDVRAYLLPLLSSWPTSSHSAETALVQRDGETVLLLSRGHSLQEAALSMASLSNGTPTAHAALGRVGQMRVIDERGADVLADTRRIPDSPWVMVTKEHASEMLSEVEFRAGLSMVAVGAIALLAMASLGFGYKYRQQVSRRNVLEVQAARLRLLQLPSEVSVEALLERSLQEAMQLTASPRGSFHILAAEGQSLVQVVFPKNRTQSSDLTSRDEREALANPTWLEDVRQGRFTHVADLASARSGKGSRKREVFAPVVREGKVVAVLGVAGKPQRYTDEDEAALFPLAELTWDIIARHRAEMQRKNLEEQLRLAQRMEAIGRLAGGVAHDFNNLLLVIQSCSEFLMEDLPEGDPRRGDVQEIRKAGERAASLTSQLLAFGRKQMLIPSVFDLNDVVESLGPTIDRLVGEGLTVKRHVSDGALPVKADRNQIEQVITNLVVNARDAIANGGTITIETRTCAGEAVAECGEREPSGRCAVLMVSDTGSGMDDEVKSRIFEPFFSTKAQGKGTGLGLATVYGIVRQSGGQIFVSSTKGQGTSFKVCLPMTEEVSKACASASHAIQKGTEKVLLVEDNPSVREQIERILTRAGYDVTTASSGDEVVAFRRERLDEFALVVSDVVMPGISGEELARRLFSMQPKLKVLLMSGYTDQSNLLADGLGPSLHFISKPFGSDVLARKVREMLNGNTSAELASAG